MIGLDRVSLLRLFAGADPLDLRMLGTGETFMGAVIEVSLQYPRRTDFVAHTNSAGHGRLWGRQREILRPLLAHQLDSAFTGAGSIFSGMTTILPTQKRCDIKPGALQRRLGSAPL